MIGIKEVGLGGLNQFVKRTIDVGIATLGLIFLSPIMFLIAVMIKMESLGPVLFEQERVGKDGRLFTIFKFRSMVEDAEEQRETLQDLNEADGPLFKIKDDPRLTRLGKFMRKWSLDELPQLFNVFQNAVACNIRKTGFV